MPKSHSLEARQRDNVTIWNWFEEIESEPSTVPFAAFACFMFFSIFVVEIWFDVGNGERSRDKAGIVAEQIQSIEISCETVKVGCSFNVISIKANSWADCHFTTFIGIIRTRAMQITRLWEGNAMLGYKNSIVIVSLKSDIPVIVTGNNRRICLAFEDDFE